MKRKKVKVKKRSTFRNPIIGERARSRRGQFSLRKEMREIDGIRKKVASSTKLGECNNVYVFRTGRYSQKLVNKNTRERIKKAS